MITITFSSSRWLRVGGPICAALLGFHLTAAGQCMQQKLVASDGDPGDQFGEQVALIPGWAFAASPQDDDVAGQSGAVYVYQQSVNDWSFAQKIKASGPLFGAAFGTSLSASGTWMVAGSPFDDPQGVFAAGSVDVFELQGGSWVHTQELVASDLLSPFTQYFGLAANLRGDRLVVGVRVDGTKSTNAGAAYVFELQGSTWAEVAKVYATDWEFGGSFGFSVAVDGDTLVVGAPEHDNAPPVGANRGAVYVFERLGGVWVQTQKLTASDAKNGDLFGISVAIDGDTIMASTCSHNHSPGNQGAVYVFTKQGSTWVQTQELFASDPAGNLNFGCWVAIEGDLALSSALTDEDLGSISGSTYVFGRFGSAWVQIGKALAPDGQIGDLFGRSIALSGTKALIGAVGDDEACPSNPACDSGSAYVFDLAPDAVQYCSCPVQGPCGNHDDFGGCASSAAQGAVLSACGSGSVVADDLVLETRWMPASVPAIYFMGGQNVGQTFGDGQLCLAPGNSGVYRFVPALSSGNAGVVTLGPGLAALTQAANPPAGQIAPGQTWYFQCWYRDPAGPCGSTFNLSNGLRVVFQP